MTEKGDYLVEIRSVSFSRSDLSVFDRFSLSIPRGKVVGILGPSGTGKTTLLRMIGRQLKPDSGEIWVDGENLESMSRKELFRMRRRMGMLFQSGALFTDLSVFENVAFPLRVHTDLTEVMIRDIVLMKLEAVGLRGARSLMPTELSGGMARRVALARAIALDPEMVMYDEPFVGQDPISVGVLLKLIKKLNHTLGITSIVVSHDLHETAAIADWLCLIAGGKLVAEGTPATLSASPDPRVKQFMSGLADGPVPFHFPAEDYRAELLDWEV